MADTTLGMTLYRDFLAQRGVADYGSYRYLDTTKHEYVSTDNLVFVRIGDEKIYVSDLVINAHKLLYNILTGHNKALEEISAMRNLYQQRTLSVAEMDRACEEMIEPALRFCIESLRYCAEKLEMDETRFLPLTQASDITYPTLLALSDKVYSIYCGRIEAVEQNAQRYKEALDRRTAGVIAAAPKTLHIEGRFREGLFTDTFEGTAYITSAMTQGDVIEAYMGNQSAANVNRMINAAQAQKRCFTILCEGMEEELARFRATIVKALAENFPTQIYGPTMLSDDYTARPYTTKNFRKLMEMADKEEFPKLKVIIKKYNINFNRRFEQEICQDVLDDYIRTDRYNYPYNDFYFLLYYNKHRFPHEHPLIHTLFMDHYKDKIRKKAAELLEDKKFKISKDATVDDFFSDIFAEADESEMLESTYAEDAELREVAEEQLAILKEKKKKGLFGW